MPGAAQRARRTVRTGRSSLCGTARAAAAREGGPVRRPSRSCARGDCPRPADATNEHQLRTFLWDLGRAAQNMVLAAWELGIGSVPATVYDLELASRLLGLPDDQRCDFLLSFGYPADPSVLTAPNRAGGRRPLDEVVHEDTW